jgi:hypothetical protein
MLGGTLIKDGSKDFHIRIAFRDFDMKPLIIDILKQIGSES